MKGKLLILILSFLSFGSVAVPAQSKEEFDSFANKKQGQFDSFTKKKQAEFDAFCKKYTDEIELFKKNYTKELNDKKAYAELMASDDGIVVSKENLAPKPAETKGKISEEISTIKNEIQQVSKISAADAIKKAKSSPDSIEQIKTKYEEVKKVNESYSKPNVSKDPKTVSLASKASNPSSASGANKTPAPQKSLSSNIPSGKPTNYVRISSPFGKRYHPIQHVYKMHNGVDLAANAMTPIYAPAAGEITGAYFSDSAGNLIKINHQNGYKTSYAHLLKLAVSKGQSVKKGDLIGYVGSTGMSTGNHLHYEMIYLDNRIDPEPTLLK